MEEKYLEQQISFFLVALTSKGVIAQGDYGIKTSQDAVYGGEGIDVLYTHT